MPLLLRIITWITTTVSFKHGVCYSFLRALSSMRLARALCFSSDWYNCRCIITQSHEANQIHIQFTSTRVYQCFFTSRKSCYLSMFSLSAPENNFPTDQTDGIGCHFVFADRVKCSRIPFSWFLYHPHRFKGANLALLNYYQPAWRTCKWNTMKKILINLGDWEPKHHIPNTAHLFLASKCISLNIQKVKI